MKVLKIAALLLCGLAGGCATSEVPLADAQANAAGKAFPAPPPGRAALYVVRESGGGTLINVAVGPRAIGPLGNFTWFRVDVDPGTHNVRCTGDEASRIVSVTLAAGETRYVETESTSGWMGLRCAIFEIPADKGRAAVLRGNRAAEFN